MIPVTCEIPAAEMRFPCASSRRKGLSLATMKPNPMKARPVRIQARNVRSAARYTRGSHGSMCTFSSLCIHHVRVGSERRWSMATRVPSTVTQIIHTQRGVLSEQKSCAGKSIAHSLLIIGRRKGYFSFLSNVPEGISSERAQ